MRRLPMLALAAALACVGAGCATNPVTGETQLALISESQEIALGREADAQVRASETLVTDEALVAYVRAIGERLAAASERPDLPWTFEVLDSPVLNAFALPGGYVYLTRGILTHFVNEAQLAGVLGHEIGHVTARHHVSQISRTGLASLGVGLGAVLLPGLAPLAGAAQGGLQLLLLKYGRDAERQADELGLRYMRAAGYDPAQMAAVLDMLASAAEAQGDARLPGWLATHPEPAERAQRIRAELPDVAAPLNTGRIARESYLARIDGLVYGADPREGVFREERFLHPGLDFQMTFPEGWATQNQKAAVLAASPQRDAAIALTLAPEDDLEAAAATVRGQGVTAGRATSLEVNDLPARAVSFRASAQGTPVSGVALFVAHADRIYRLLGYARSDRWDAVGGAIERSLTSFARLGRTDGEFAPRRVHVAALPRAMSLATLHAETSPAIDLDTLARLNQVEPAQRLPAGTRVKLVR